MNNRISSNIIFPFILKCYGENALEKLKEFDKSQWFSSKIFEEFQFKKLKAVFCYAYENIPYYRKIFQAYGLNPYQIQSFSDIEKYPVLTKEDVKDNYKELMIYPYPKRFEKRSTSGTTGLSLHFIKDRNATACMRAIDLRSYGWHGIKPGEKQARFWSSGLNLKDILKEKIKDGILNRQRYSVLAISDKNLRKYYNDMKRFKPAYIYGYASAIFEIADFIIKNRLSPVSSLKIVITTSEMLFSRQREFIEKAFQCRCVNEYGCSELGIIAFECPYGKLHLMSDNLYVEFTENGKKVLPEQTGDILISELNSFAMPFLRYKIGDLGSYSTEKCSCGRTLPVMNSLDGRENSFFKTPDGSLIYDNIFDFMIKSPEVKIFKVILEKPDSLLIKIMPENNFLSEQAKDEFNIKLRRFIGNAMQIRFQITDEIKRTSSGKRNYFESLVNSNRLI